MIKYLPRLTEVVLEEIPGKVTLAVEISNCQGSCIGCHSPFLRTDIGDELSFEVVKMLIDSNFGINCLLFLGEGNDQEALLSLARQIKQAYHNMELAVYSGRPEVEEEYYEIFDYVKIGPYIEEFGPLNSPTTNQKLFHKREDITYKFWRKQ